MDHDGEAFLSETQDTTRNMTSALKPSIRDPEPPMSHMHKTEGFFESSFLKQ